MKEGWLSPRTNVKHRGFTVFQSAMGVDRYGFQYIGIQVSRDPGEPLFWIGAVILSISLPLFLFLKHSRA